MNIVEKIQGEFQQKMNEEELLNCMRCGFCLPSCPTYIETNQHEAASPRGRIALMKAVMDGVIEPDEDVERQLNLCLGCRACEPVCPSGVKYGHLLEEARDIIAQNKKHTLPVRLLRKLVFKHFFPYQNRVRLLVRFMSWYQHSGLQTLVRKSGFLKVMPGNIAQMERVLPILPTKQEMKEHPTHLPAQGTARKRVSFFSGCLMDTMFLETNKSTLQLLQMAGCEIIIPPAQNCCGALHGHSGEKDLAKKLAKQNIKAFEELDVDAIIINAGGCGAFLSEYGHLLQNEPEWVVRAQTFASKITDLTTVLVELNFHQQELHLEKQIITYQDSCHLRNVLGTSNPPRKLLQSIKGSKYQEMQDADRCCGSAGIYNIVEQEMSMQILDRKMEFVQLSKATTIVTNNPGCLIQMKLGIERAGLQKQMQAVHIADLLLEALEPHIKDK